VVTNIRVVLLLPIVFGVAVLFLIQGFDALGGGQIADGAYLPAAGAAR
jgi:hypothetical protein